MTKNSPDFQRLMQLIHDEGAKVQEVRFEPKDGMENATIILKKQDETITLESTEDDMCMYVWNFQQSCDGDGNGEFSVVTNLEGYFDDIQRMVNDQGKFQEALKDYADGKTKLSFEPTNMINEFIGSPAKQRFPSFKPLRDEYLTLLAWALVRRNQMRKHVAEMKGKTPSFEHYENAIMPILQGASSLGRNPVENYSIYQQLVTLDMEEALRRLNSQQRRKNRLMSVITKVTPIEGDIGSDLMLKFYAELAELCAAPIESLRNCVQRTNEGSIPETLRSANDNCDYLAANGALTIVQNLKPSIRNAVAHVSYEIDHESHQVVLRDEGRVLQYSYQELAEMTNRLGELPVPLLFCIELQKYNNLMELLDSKEFRMLLFKIGHQKFAA